MAGGRSERMRATAGQIHKALVPVLGISMLERNLLSLLGHGFLDIVVAVSAKEPEIIDYIKERRVALVRSHGVSLRCYEEETPLGTIGVAAALDCHSEPLLVVNVDNLTALDLRALVNHHRVTGASLTIATHVESFRVPFGQVVVKDGEVTEYREKPTFEVLLSSGTYVASSAARSLIPRNRRTDLPELFLMLREQGQTIVSFMHDAPWIDVNDAAALVRAEELIKNNRPLFASLHR